MVEPGWRELFATRSNPRRTEGATVAVSPGPLVLMVHCVGPGRVEVKAPPVTWLGMPCPAGEVSRFEYRNPTQGADHVTISVHAPETVTWKLSVQQRARP